MKKNKIIIREEIYKLIDAYLFPYVTEIQIVCSLFEDLLYTLKSYDQEKLIKDTDIVNAKDALLKVVLREPELVVLYTDSFEMEDNEITISKKNLKRLHNEIAELPSLLKDKVNFICDLLLSKYENTNCKEDIKSHKNNMLLSINNLCTLKLHLCRMLEQYDKSIVERIIQTILMENDT